MYSWTGWWDPKRRHAKRAARLILKDAQKLLRRARRSLKSDILDAVQGSIQALQAAQRVCDVSKLEQASHALRALVDKHLVSFRKPAWRESIESIAMAVFVALLLRSFIVEAYQIPTGSMVPTLAVGDQIFVNKYVYGWRIPFTAIRWVNFGIPKRGEVVVFMYPIKPKQDYVKRVIGLPGDEIVVHSGHVYVNGKAIKRERIGPVRHWDRDSVSKRWYRFSAVAYQETLGDHTYTVLQDADGLHKPPDFGPYKVPADHLFMMGDNRDHSYDSRAWGPVPLQNVLGRSLFVWWSWGHKGLNIPRLLTWIE